MLFRVLPGDRWETVVLKMSCHDNQRLVCYFFRHHYNCWIAVYSGGREGGKEGRKEGRKENGREGEREREGEEVREGNERS